MNTGDWSFTPVAYLRTTARHRFEAPRQAVFAGKPGFVEFVPGMSAAAADLAGFERIWLIFCFHLNVGKGWKPLVRPPLSPDGGCYGLFATRSPYRPNPIGISCVELLEVRKDGLVIGPCDLLDGTPILDIKPYIAEVDAFPDAAAGWRDGVMGEAWEINFTSGFLEQAARILELGGPDVVNFCRVQLRFNPFDRRRKRVAPDGGGGWQIGCRTWRINFSAELDERKITVCGVVSNYLPEELAAGAPDPYEDKELHREFLS